MKKYISYLLTLALIVPAFVSCTQERDFLSRKQKTHTVHFATTEPATRTGLTIEDNMVKPDWRKTDLENIHFFEIDATNAAAPGTADEINLSDDNRTAHFKAAISDDITIIVSPSDGDNGSKGAKSAGVSPFTFAAVVAQMPDKNAYTFVIPSEQHPDAETLKDPNAEFLVGYSRKSYVDQYDYDDVVVDLYFDRVAALGRLAITGFVGTGEKVKSVTITAAGGMTGKATYPGDFTLGDKNKVNFKKVDEPLVLNYGENGVAAPAEGAFYAYFVAAPGEASVTSIEVLTDQYKYTKTVEGGASFTFSDEQLLNIVFALSEDIAESVTADNNTWYKASVLEAGYDYLIVSGGQALKNNNGETAAIAVDPQDGVITFESSTDPTIVWTAKAHVEYYDADDTKPAGHYTLSQGEGDATLYFERYSNQQTQNGSIASAPTEDTNGNYKYYVWEYDGEHFYQISRDGADGVYCLTYNSGWKFEYQSKPNTYLYTNRPPVEISFASAEAKYDLDNGEWTVAIPELTAPEGSVVTYSSSDEEIATVAADGTVTPKAAGSVRITATVEGNDEHQGGSAYYELIVSTSKITTWYKAEEMVDGETYLIVSHEYVLENNAGTANAVKVDFSGDVIQYNAPATVLWEAKATSTSGVFTLQNNGQYLYRVSSGSGYNQSYAPGASSSASSYYQWSYNSETERVSTKGTTNTYYVYYSTNNTKWSMSTTEADHPAALYSSTPGLVSRNLKFSAETVTHDLADGEDVNEPELTGDSLEGITYAVTEGKDVASVDANTGVVTLAGKTGSAVITASASKTKTYKAESVSYTLVVKDSNVPTKRYVLANSIVAGKKYLIVSEGHALKNNSGEVASEAVTPVSNEIEIESGQETDLEWTAVTENTQTSYGHFVLSNGGYRLNRKSSSGNFSVTFVSTSTAMDKYGVWDLQEYNGIFYLFHDSSTTMRFWLSYNNGWKLPYLSVSNGGDITNPTASNITNGPVHATQLYVEDDGGVTPPTPEERDQTLSFPEASYTAQVGTAFTAPSVSGAQTTVTYTSSKETVATVNASTGAVTLVGPGETIITASAAAEIVNGISYKAASAQYTLTVEDTSPSSNKTFTKVSAFTSGKKYIIVDGTNALMNNSGEDALYSVSGKISGNTLTVSSSEVDAIEWTVVSNAAHTTQGDFTIKNGEYYLTRANTTNENNDVTLSESVTAYTVWTLDGSNLRQKNSSGQYTFYLHVVNSNRWTANTQTAPNNITIYEESAGGDPTPTTTSYSRVSFATGITTGKYLIVNPADAQVFTTVTSYPNSASVTPSNGVISGDYASYEVTITKSGDNYTIQNANGQYLYYVYTSGDTQTRVAYKSDTENWAASSVSSDANGFDLNCSGGNGRQHIYWNDSTAGTFFKIGSQSTGVHLYKKADNL